MRSAITLLVVVLASADGAEDTLRHNPFSRPDLGNRAAPGSGADGALDLRAVLVAGRRSLANVGGELIGVGDSVNGFELIGVGDGHARFRRGDETLTVHPQEPDEEESENED